MTDLSVVIPCFNRPGPLRMTVRSAVRAAKEFGGSTEIILVDDGSMPPVEEQLRGFDPGAPLVFLRQPNQGSIVARHTGLFAAKGEFVLFLDSDDVVHPQKFSRQVAAMRSASADVSYADMAKAVSGKNDEVAAFEPEAPLPLTSDAAQLYIGIQPAPHNPIYRRDYLVAATKEPIVPMVREMDPSGDVWLFYNLSVFPARITKVEGPFSAAGPHTEDRYSSHWERLGAASLQIMELFVRNCPKNSQTTAARQAVGEAAYRTWRGLPRDFNSGFLNRMLQVYRKSPRGPTENLGSPGFARLASAAGPVIAGKLTRLMRARPYSESRTLSDSQYGEFLAKLSASE